MDAQQALLRAISLHSAGQLGEAAESYLGLLALQPQNPDLLFLLGTLRLQQGQLSEAQAVLSALLQQQPEHIEGWLQLAEVFYSNGQIAEALGCYQQLLNFSPENAMAQARALECQGALVSRAQQAMEAALSAYRSRDFVSAIRQAQESLAIVPSASGWNNLGVMYKEQGSFGEAENALRQAVSLAPDYAEAWSNLGNVYWLQHHYPAALDAYERAVQLQPDNAVSWNNLGNGRQAVGRVDEALAAFEQALQLEPAFAMAHWNHAIAALLNGDYRTGWEEYEWGFASGLRPVKFQPLPLWQGETATRLIVYAEQGYGDTLQFVRFLPALQRRVAQLILVVPAELQRLLQRSFPAVRVMLESQVNRQDHDAVLPLMSAPYRLGLLQPDEFATASPYLTVDPAQAALWHERLSGFRGRRVGIAWQGSRKHKGDPLRSLAADRLVEALAGCSDISLHSLQAGPDAPEVPPEVIDWRSAIQDFDDLAVIVHELDGVVTVDTAVAHLAGALGKRVYLLLPFAPDWRWGRYSEQSVWYGRMQLFRQSSPGDWDSALCHLANELRKI